MAGTTTAMCMSFKAELAQGMHSFAPDRAEAAATMTNATTGIASITDTTNVSIGMKITGTSVAANARVAEVLSATAITTSIVNTGGTTNAITFVGDIYKTALIKVTPTGTYGVASTNYTNITGNSDEVSAGGGYSTGGFAWTSAQNILPATTSPSAFWSWTTNPSWTSATFSCTAMMIYDTGTRGGQSATGTNRAVSCHDFGGTQTVSAGTFTVVLPTNAVGTAILQIT